MDKIYKMEKTFREVWSLLTSGQTEYLQRYINHQRQDAVKNYKKQQLLIADVIVCSNCKFNGMQPMNDSPCDMYNASEQTCSNYNKL
tara:strand:+ start:408 stop:668 length:261 start_codon:yes stop_codon:yes gene_type:complete